MATFTKVWAIKTQFQANPGDVIEVALKRGGVKPVTLGSYLYERNGAYFYASPREGSLMLKCGFFE
jgi:hypothetical protein